MDEETRHRVIFMHMEGYDPHTIADHLDMGLREVESLIRGRWPGWKPTTRPKEVQAPTPEQRREHAALLLQFGSFIMAWPESRLPGDYDGCDVVVLLDDVLGAKPENFPELMTRTLEHLKASPGVDRVILDGPAGPILIWGPVDSEELEKDLQSQWRTWLHRIAGS
jgi:hypothetical protein